MTDLLDNSLPKIDNSTVFIDKKDSIIKIDEKSKVSERFLTTFF